MNEYLFHLCSTGRDLLNQRQYQKAVEVLNDALSISGDDIEAKILILKGIGTAYYGMQLWEKAIECVKQELELSPDDPSCYLRLGCAYLDNKQYELAERTLKISLRMNPACCDSRYHLGSLYKHMGKWHDAIIEYKTAASLRPESAEILFSLAVAYVAIGNIVLGRKCALVSANLGLAEAKEFCEYLERM